MSNQVPWALLLDPFLAWVQIRGQFCALSFILKGGMVMVPGGDPGNVACCVQGHALCGGMFCGGEACVWEWSV